MAAKGFSTSNYISNTSGLPTVAPLTMFCWFKPATFNGGTSTPPSQTLMYLADPADNNDFYALDVLFTRVARFKGRHNAANNGLANSAALSVDTWYAIAGSNNGASSHKVWLNGTATTVSGGAADTLTDLRLGVSNDAGTLASPILTGGGPLPRGVGAGVAVDGDGAGAFDAIAPAFPATVVNEDIAFFQIVGSDTGSGGGVTLNTPPGFTPLFNDAAANGSGELRQGIFWKQCDGTEGGSTVSISGSTSGAGLQTTKGLYARIWVFSDVALSSFSESGGSTTGTDTTAEISSITSSVDNCLGMFFLAVANDVTQAALTGNTATWSEAAAEFTSATGPDASIGLQTAPLATAGTFSGGAATVGAGPVVWLTRSFSMKPRNSGAQGKLAHCAVWNVELSADDHAELATGISPLMVRPDALVFYAPLLDNATLNEIVTANTLNGSLTFEDDDQVRYWPWDQRFGGASVTLFTVTVDFGGVMEFEAGLKRDIGAPEDAGVGLFSSPTSPLELATLLRADVVYREESAAVSRGDIGGPADAGAGLRGDQASPLQIITTLKVDQGGLFNSLANLSADIGDAIDYGAGLRADISTPLDYAVGLRADLVGPLTWSANLAGSVSSSEDSGAGARSDLAAPLDLAAGLSADVSSPVTSSANLSAEAAARDESGAGLALSVVAPIEFAARIAADFVGPGNWNANASADSASPIDFGGALRADIVGPLEYGVALRSDLVSPIDIEARLRGDLVGPEDPLANLMSSPLAPVDWVGNVAAQTGGLINWTGSQQADNGAPAETGAGGRADTAAPLEQASGVRGDLVAQDTSSANLTANTGNALEAGAITRADAAAPVDYGQGVRSDGSDPLEISAGVKHDDSDPVEWSGAVTSTLNADVASPLEFAAGVRSDRAGPDDQGGGVAGIGLAQTAWSSNLSIDTSTPIDEAAGLRSDIGSFEDSGQGLRAELGAPVTFNASLAVDQLIRLDWLGAVVASAGGPIESASGVKSDAGSPADAAAGARSDVAAPSDFGARLRSDVTPPIEWLQTTVTVMSDARSPLDFGASVAGGGSSPIDWASGIDVTIIVSLEFEGNVVSTAHYKGVRYPTVQGVRYPTTTGVAYPVRRGVPYIE